jgi:hypothetical protein
VQAYFEKEVYFGCKLIFREGSIFGKYLTMGKEDLTSEQNQQVTRKNHAKKEGKTTCKRKHNVVRRQASLTMIWLGFLKNIVTTISL